MAIIKNRMKVSNADAILEQIMLEKGLKTSKSEETLVYPCMLIYGNLSALKDIEKDFIEIMSRRNSNIYFGDSYNKDMDVSKNLTIVYYIDVYGKFHCKKNTHIKKKELLNQSHQLKEGINDLKWVNWLGSSIAATTTKPNYFVHYNNNPAIKTLQQNFGGYVLQTPKIDTEAEVFDWDSLVDGVFRK